MPRNGSGIYSLPAGNPVTSGTAISSTVQNNTTSDIATALTGSLASDGQTVPTANLPMGGFKHTNAADGSNLADYATVKQVQNSFGIQLTGVSGSNIITGTATPAPAAYVAGQRFSFIAASPNVGAATLNISGLGAKSITKNGATALDANDILTGALIEVEYDGTRFQIINPATLGPSGGTVTGAVTLSSTLNVTGAAALASTLAVTGVATFTAAPVGPTQAASDNSTKLATTAHVLSRLQRAPSFSAGNATQQSLTTGVAAKITLGTETYDTGGYFASSRFTPLVPGYYQFSYRVGMIGTAITGAFAMLYYNGVEVDRGSQIAIPSGAAMTEFHSSGSFTLFMNGATDYAELYAQASGASMVADYSRFSGTMVRPI